MRQTFFVVFFVGLLVRSLFLILGGHDTQKAFLSDTHEYVRLAQTLHLENKFGVIEDGTFTPEITRTPGFPFFLSLFFSDGKFNFVLFQWVQVFLGALTAGLFFLLANLLWNNKTYSAGAGIAIAIDLVAMVNGYFILSETLFLFLLSSWLYLTVRSFKSDQKRIWEFLLLGFGFGLICLVRPISLFYLPFLIFLGMVYFFIKKDRKILFYFVVLYVGQGVLLQAWALRNFNQTGTWTVTQLGNENIRRIRLPYLEMARTGKSYDEVYANLLGEIEKDPKKGSYLSYIVENPGIFIKVFLKDGFRFFVSNSIRPITWILVDDDKYNPHRLPQIESKGLAEIFFDYLRTHPLLGLILIVYLILLGIIYCLSILGFGLAWREFPHVALLMVSPIIYYFLITIGAVTLSRYRLPALVGLFPLAVGGAISVQKLRKSKNATKTT